MIVCCDPKALPRADRAGKLKIDRNNRIRLPAGDWITVTCLYPSTIETLADPGGHLIAYPETETPADLTTVKQSNEPVGQRSLFLHAIGQWRVRNTGSTSVETKILDAHNGIAALFQSGIRIGNGVVSLSPVSGGAITMAAPAVVSVGGASGTALAANANRKFLYLRNMDAAKVISLGFDNQTAVNGSGVVLNPGEQIAMQAPGEAQTVGIVTAIANPATANLAIQEGS